MKQLEVHSGALQVAHRQADPGGVNRDFPPRPSFVTFTLDESLGERDSSVFGEGTGVERSPPLFCATVSPGRGLVNFTP